MLITSPAFRDNGPIPTRFAHKGIPGGSNISPPLVWSLPPSGTKSFAIAMIDRHQSVDFWTHWIIFNIPVFVNELPAEASPARLPAGTVEFINSFGERGYGGPFPFRGSGIHRYLFTLFALDVEYPALSPYLLFQSFKKNIEGHILSSCSMTGIFER